MAGLGPRDRSVLTAMSARYSSSSFEEVQAPLLGPGGLRLLRVVAEFVAELWSMMRPACGGSSLIVDMHMYGWCGDGVCDETTRARCNDRRMHGVICSGRRVHGRAFDVGRCSDHRPLAALGIDGSVPLAAAGSATWHHEHLPGGELCGDFALLGHSCDKVMEKLGLRRCGNKLECFEVVSDNSTTPMLWWQQLSRR